MDSLFRVYVRGKLTAPGKEDAYEPKTQSHYQGG